MNKYFSKALIFSEKNNCIQAITILSVFLGMRVVQFLLNQSWVSDGNFQGLVDYLFHIMFIILAGIFAMQSESYKEKEVKYNFLLSQPFKRDAIVITKYFVTIISILIPIILYGVSVTIILFLNNQQILIVDLWRNILVVSVTVLLLSATIQFSQHIISNSILASFMTFILVFIFPMVFGSLALLIPSLRSLTPSIEKMAKTIMDLLNNIGLLGGMSILILISFFIVYSSILINRRIRFEKISELFLFKGVERFAVGVISFLLANLIAVAIIVTFKLGFDMDLTEGFTLIIIDIFVVFITVGLYKLNYYIKRRMA